MKWKWLLRIFVAGGFLMFAVGGLLIVFTHRQRDYRNLVDTHDLQARVRQLGLTYLERRPGSALVVGVALPRGSHVIGLGSVKTNGAAPDGDSVFEIGSITKVFTAVALARMSLAHEVSLDDPLSRYLPSEVACPRFEGREISLKDLATHTAGLPRLPDNLGETVQDPADPFAHYRAADLYRALSVVRLSRALGTRSIYSEMGFGLLGHALCLKAGKDYGTLVNDLVCQPLELRDTVVEMSAEQTSRLTPGNGPRGERAGSWHFDVLAGSGALHSTANDLLRFTRANFETPNSEMTRALELARQVQFRAFMGSVGLGWQIREPAPDTLLNWHDGVTGGHSSFLGLDSKANVGVVVLSGTADALAGDSEVDRLGMEILKLSHKISWE
jgi:D-alanyl-D-alanine-carboxypeptidase/D-alanyl-D-alanine-endopeptidase